CIGVVVGVSLKNNGVVLIGYQGLLAPCLAAEYKPCKVKPRVALFFEHQLDHPRGRVIVQLGNHACNLTSVSTMCQHGIDQAWQPRTMALKRIQAICLTYGAR